MAPAYIKKLEAFYREQRKAARKAEPELGKVAEAIERTIGVRGTFYATEAHGLGAGGATDRIVSAVEQTEKHTKELANAARRGGGLKFG